MSGTSQAKPGGAAVPRGRRTPSAIPVGRDSVEPSNERSEASNASIPASGGRSTSSDARSARAPAPGRGKQGSTESRPTSPAQEAAPPYRADSSASPLEGEGRGEVPPLRFIDLFCGIGGFRIAFERAGGKCVFSSDWDNYSQKTYAANFGETPHGDIHSVAVADIPKFDILCGGFPCQPFSLAGVSKKNSLGRKHGFEDEKQGNLVFSIAGEALGSSRNRRKTH